MLPSLPASLPSEPVAASLVLNAVLPALAPGLFCGSDTSVPFGFSPAVGRLPS